jgi:hypothetical protein
MEFHSRDAVNQTASNARCIVTGVHHRRSRRVVATIGNGGDAGGVNTALITVDEAGNTDVL